MLRAKGLTAGYWLNVANALYTSASLKAMNFKDYGQLTVLINGDVEISSSS